MRWQTGRRSENVEDRRRMSPGLAVGGGAGTIIIIILALLFGVNPSALLSQLNNGAGPGASITGGSAAPPTAAEQEMKDFVSVVLADTEDVWGDLFREAGSNYRPPTLVLFTGQVRSACGYADAAVGPFYCGGDEKVYLDLSFFNEMRRVLNAPGDFAQAYVIAHEIGHHVQKQLGIMDKIHSLQSGMSKTEANQLSVRLELQADFFAGVWANHAQKMRDILEPGDLEEALNAATQIGDDRLQKQSRGCVVPDSFTHGTSAQRLKWFRKGFESGKLSDGDTFNAPDL